MTTMEARPKKIEATPEISKKFSEEMEKKNSNDETGAVLTPQMAPRRLE